MEPAAKSRRLGQEVCDTATVAAWTSVIDRCIPAIVALRITAVRAFEDEGAGVSWGTGFVVDASRGIVLTNRHVIQVGPTRALATFDQHEEVDADVVYRDPLHDFALLRFNPAALHLTRLAEIGLAPEKLRVGAEVRVMGNDDGEKLQILQGTIARVDRNAPEYGDGPGDENTFYAGCGSNCSGGASGSPVIDCDGNAVAMLSGGSTGASTDFLLPMDRVVYALDHCRRNERAPRGSICVRFVFKPWAQAQKFGISEAMRDNLIAQSSGLCGLLAVERPLEGSAAQSQVRPGDLLVHMAIGEGAPKLILDFVALESSLDISVGQTVKLHLLRAGEQIVTAPIDVLDLFALTPCSFLEFGGGVFQDISYMTARHFQLPISSGVLSAESGLTFGPTLPDQSIITHIGDKHVKFARELAAILPEIPEGSYFQVRFINKTANSTRRQCKMLKMQCAFAPMSFWQEQRTESSSLRWTKSDLLSKTVGIAAMQARNGCDYLPETKEGAVSLARITFRAPCDLATDIILDKGESNGAKTVRRTGVGFLARDGLVITDRHCVPQPLGDVEVTFGQQLTLQARAVFFHPEQNLVLISIPDVRPGQLRPAWLANSVVDGSCVLAPGQKLHFVGLDDVGHEVRRDVTVATLSLPRPAPIPSPPRFSERNSELLDLAEPLPPRWAGLLFDDCGKLAAFYTLFARSATASGKSLPWKAAGILRESLQRFAFQLPSAEFGVDLEEISLAALRHERDFDRLGPGASILKEWKPNRPVALCVSRVDQCSAAAGILTEGDVLVKVNGEYVRDGAAALARAPQDLPLNFEVFREGAMSSLSVVPRSLGSDGCCHLAVWHGLVCVETPRYLRRAGLLPRVLVDGDAEKGPGVYVVRVCFGSPAQAGELKSQVWVLEVDGCSVRRLQDLPKRTRASGEHAAGELPPMNSPTSFVRIKTANHFEKETMETLRPDALFWPEAELWQEADGTWTRREAS